MQRRFSKNIKKYKSITKILFEKNAFLFDNIFSIKSSDKCRSKAKLGFGQYLCYILIFNV